ncbi:MAG: radical SAM protein [Promethearchaeota archaeon]|nr:MAG: radical SAM protein [Candidatus Lokiarchaeota archaeon]
MEEQNIIIKDWRYIDASFGLVYPNIYSIGMASYSIRLLYSLINDYEELVCERIFLPEKLQFPASKDYHSNDTLRSIETGRSPHEFDILGFSMQFENDFRNILWCLEKANIPILRESRLKKRREKGLEYPLIIGGGPVSTSNPQPLSKIFDTFVIGDFEPNLLNFFNLFLDYKASNLKFNELLRNLAKIEGFYVPSIKSKVKRRIIKNLDESPIPVYQLIARSENKKRSLSESFFLEVNRGCPFNCKFCISSYHNKPFRNRTFENIEKTLKQAIEFTNFKRISLIGSCISSHPQFYDICKLIIENKKEISIPSIRIDHLTPKIIDILARGGIKTITIAPETGSEQLRYKLGKKISDDMIYNSINLIRKSKIENIKMYFLIGLPSETENDVKDTIKMIKWLDKLGFGKDSLRISINPMVPKLNTPYERSIKYYLSENKEIMLSRFERLKNELMGLSSIKLRLGNVSDLMKQARLQALLSLGDEKVSQILIKYYQKGATYGALKSVKNQLDFSINKYFLKIKNGYSPWKWE